MHCIRASETLPHGILNLVPVVGHLAFQYKCGRSVVKSVKKQIFAGRLPNTAVNNILILCYTHVIK